MNAKRKFQLWWRWSLLLGGLIAISWTVWGLYIGRTPIAADQFYEVSRLWDIFIPVIWFGMILACFPDPGLKLEKSLHREWCAEVLFLAVAGALVAVSTEAFGEGIETVALVGLIVGGIVGLVAAAFEYQATKAPYPRWCRATANGLAGLVGGTLPVALYRGVLGGAAVLVICVAEVVWVMLIVYAAFAIAHLPKGAAWRCFWRFMLAR